MNNDNLNHEYLLDNLMKKTSDSIYFKDLESRFIMVNQACADKHGWDNPESIIGSSDFDTFSREHAEQAYADEQRIIKTGQPLDSLEEKETWPDGSVTWVSTTKMPLRDENGNIMGIFGVSRDITERKEAELKAKKYADQIRAIKEEMEEEVRMAGQLQKNFCPSSFPVYPANIDPENSCVDFSYRFNLRRQVTGDYCAIIKVSDTETGIFISDVAGIGVRAALGTALIRGIMQEISGLSGQPGSYLARMNELLLPLLHKENLIVKVSACYVVLNVVTGRVRLANAAHTMPLLFKGEGLAEWLCGDSDCVGPALAERAGATYAEVEHDIEPDDSIVMFTDGLFKVENAANDLYGKKRLLDSAHSLSGEPLEDIFDGLEGDAQAFATKRKFTDDVCLIGLHLRKRMEQG